MNEALTEVKKTLKWLKQSHPTRVRHKKAATAEELEIMMTLIKGRLVVTLRFQYYPVEDNLSCFYEIVRNTKKDSFRERYSFMNPSLGKTLPGISEAGQETLKSAFAFSLEENQIKSQIAPLTQATIFCEVIRENFLSMVEVAKEKGSHD
jgi:hypothetical protein